MEHTLENKKEIKTSHIIIFTTILRLFTVFFGPWKPAYDLFHFMFPWMMNMEQNGFWAMYAENTLAPYAVDYPPIYYASMFLTTGKLSVIAGVESDYLAYVLLRLFPTIIDILFCYFICKYMDKKLGLIYAFAIPFIVDCGIYAQSDCLFIFEMFVLFYFYIEKKDLKMTSIMYAVMVCTKLQGLYFLPIFLLMVYAFEEDNKKKIKDFLYGVFAGILIWLPWLIVEGPMHFFKIYLGSSTANYVMAQTVGNIWFLFGLNILPQQITSGAFYFAVNIITLSLCLLILFKTYNKTKDITWTTFVYLFSIFMLTPHQYNRYELYALGAIILVKHYHPDIQDKNLNYIFWAMFVANTAQIFTDFYHGDNARFMIIFIVSLVMIALYCNIMSTLRLFKFQKVITEEKI